MAMTLTPTPVIDTPNPLIAAVAVSRIKEHWAECRPGSIIMPARTRHS